MIEGKKAAREGWKSQTERDYRFNVIIVSAFLNPFNKKGSLPAPPPPPSFILSKKSRIWLQCWSRCEKPSAPVPCSVCDIWSRLYRGCWRDASCVLPPLEDDTSDLRPPIGRFSTSIFSCQEAHHCDLHMSSICLLCT